MPKRLTSEQVGGCAVWLVPLLLLTVAGCCRLSRTEGESWAEQEFSFVSSYDSTRQLAVVYAPSAPLHEPVPLLVVAHYLGGTRFTAREIGYYDEVRRRGWLLVCPELHGHRTPGQTSFAALEAQHDVIDAIGYVQERYPVDPTRIYVAGRSMGGMLAAMMAAKYPDLFAGAVVGQGISDLQLWVEESPRFRDAVVAECLVYHDSTAFDYARRSSIFFAPNLAMVPVVFWHGTNDWWVVAQQTSRLHDSLRVYNPYVEPVHWIQQAPHCDGVVSAGWVCDRLEPLRNVCEAGDGTITRYLPRLTFVTDEDKRYYWIGVERHRGELFARISARMQGDTAVVAASNTRRITIHEERIGAETTVRYYRYSSSDPVELKLRRRDGSVVRTLPGKRGSGAFL